MSPCKECNKRHVGCHARCYELLEWKVFHRPEHEKYSATNKAKKSGMRQKQRDDAKRKEDMQYYLKYNKNQTNTYCCV